MEAWFWILGWFLSILTMTGNGFIVFLVCKRRQLRTKTNAFVASLAVADFCVGMSAIPSLFFCEMTRGATQKVYLFSNVVGSIRWLFVFASMGNLCSLVLDRYIAIVKPLTYLTFMKRRRVIQMISLSWAILISSLWFTLKSPFIITLSGWLSVVLELIECAIVLFCFITMLAVVYRHEGTTRTLAKRISFNHRVMLKNQENFAVKMMGIIITLFLICNGIFFRCSFMLIFNDGKPCSDLHNHSFKLISSLLFARKAFGNVKTSNFVSKNTAARTDNFTSCHGRMIN